MFIRGIGFEEEGASTIVAEKLGDWAYCSSSQPGPIGVCPLETCLAETCSYASTVPLYDMTAFELLSAARRRLSNSKWPRLLFRKSPRGTGALAIAVATAAFVSANYAYGQGVSRPATNLLLEGKAAYGDWRLDAPGVRRHFGLLDLPEPYSSRSAANTVSVVRQPANARLKVPPGFEIRLFASGLDQPRLICVAPNGDVFIVESSAGRIRLLRPAADGAEVSRDEVFTTGLNLPFGVAFYPSGRDPQWIYVANTDSIIRFPYRNGDLRAQKKAEVIVPKLPAGGGHWTRDIVFSRDNTK
ncbi:MAG: hypothetical protein WBX25_04705, partial [Rhodomicrobium sp.]